MIAFFGDLANQLSPPILNIDLGQQISVLNLEGPILDPEKLNAHPPIKAGPRLSSRENILESFAKNSSSWIFSLANNHSFDFGIEGFIQTFQSLAKYGIQSCGAGINEREASKVLELEVDGVGIAIICCADRGFGHATNQSSGFALEGNWIFREIIHAKSRNQVPVILYHGGVEDFSLHSPHTKRLFESWADVGAKLVVGTHSHVPQPITKYGSSVFCYGLGNFLVDPNEWCESGDATLSSLCLVFDPVRDEVSFHPMKVQVNRYGATEVFQVPFSNELNRRLKVCSEILDDPELHLAVWQEMCIDIGDSWLKKHLAFSIATEIAPNAIKKIPYWGKFFRIPYALDTFGWSTHREMLLELSSIKHDKSRNNRTKISSDLWLIVKG